MKSLSLLILLSLVLAACGTQPADIQPPEIAYGQDVCEACGMIIDDARFAAATLLINEETRKFDDLGEMFNYHAKNPDLQVKAWFIHDYASQQWTRGETAHYVINLQLLSPMDKGIVAFAEQSDAKAYAQEHDGQTATFEEVRAQTLSNTTAYGHQSH